MRFLLLGDVQSLPSAQRFRDALPERSIMAVGTLALRASAALMAQLDLYVGVDTGPTHIAGALGIPMVALYHPAYPGRNLAPLQNPRCRVIEHPRTGSDPSVDASMADIPAEAAPGGPANRSPRRAAHSVRMSALFRVETGQIGAIALVLRDAPPGALTGWAPPKAKKSPTPGRPSEVLDRR